MTKALLVDSTAEVRTQWLQSRQRPDGRNNDAPDTKSRPGGIRQTTVVLLAIAEIMTNCNTGERFISRGMNRAL